MTAASAGGLRFECTLCGQCCRVRGEYAYVYVSDAEVRRLAQFLGLAVGAFKRLHTFVDGDGWRQLAFREDRCVFLDEADRCAVYAARPKQCRTFPFWRELVEDGDWSEEARRLCEGTGQGRLHDPVEVEARIAEADLPAEPSAVDEGSRRPEGARKELR